MSLGAHFETCFVSETLVALCEKSEARDKVVGATLASDEVFAAKDTKFMIGRKF